MKQHPPNKFCTCDGKKRKAKAPFEHLQICECKRITKPEWDRK